MNYGPQALAAAARQTRSAPGGGRYSLWNKYFSTVCFGFAAGAGFTYTVASGTEYRAFSYGIGTDMASVGFPSGTAATNAETNVSKANETTGGEAVTVYGISALLTSDSDAMLAKALWPNVSVLISLNGDHTIFKLGTLEFIPGAGGLTGVGESFVQVPAIAEYSAQAGCMTNGLAQVSNFMPFPQPITWLPTGQEDSQFGVRLRAERSIPYTSALAVDRAAAAGVAPWTHPTALNNTIGSPMVKIKIHLHSRQDGPRSQQV